MKALKQFTIPMFVVLLLAPFFLKAQQEYAGSERCRTCHVEIYSKYEKSGHPYKLQKITGTPPSFPQTTSSGVPEAPRGESWQSISYVIGGFGWKARFLDSQGYILTGANKQYNLANSKLDTPAHWVNYDDKSAPKKPYTCGSCHTTGWVATGEMGPHQDDLPGIHGTWSEPGVTCEACHGPSAAHVNSPIKVKPPTEERCSQCHVRGEPTQIDAKNGLIRHHEQYEDLLASPHQSLQCSTCHDPHGSTIYPVNKTDNAGVCLQCHQGQTIKPAVKAHMDCTNCHMPYAVKSAISKQIDYQGGSIPVGDLRTHIKRISLDPDWKMFTEDGKFVRVDGEHRAYLTVEYSCLSCHSDKDPNWARSQAKDMHE